jgi:hypothetical protein
VNAQSGACTPSFMATANVPVPSTGWQFDHWTWTGGVSCTSSTANPANCIFSSTGSLTAVFRAQVTFMVNPVTSAVIGWGSCAGPNEGNGVSIYGTNFGSVPACYVPSGYTFSSWSCMGGLSCSASNDPTTASFTGPGTITLNLKTGSIPLPASTNLTASASPPNPSHGTSFTVSGRLRNVSNGVGIGGKQIVLVFGWSTNIVTVMTAGDGSYTYTSTAPMSSSSYDVDAFFLGDFTGTPQYLPSKATDMITVA